MRHLACFLLLGVAAAAAAMAAGSPRERFSEVYVADFKSEEPASCRPSDVPLDHARARHFFRRARVVDDRVIHDHYAVAPCWVEGTLLDRGKSCEWRIRAGATAEIRCGKRTRHYVCDDCDDCEDLFREP